MKNLIICLLLCLSASLPLPAQENCAEDMTEKCLTHLVNQALKTDKAFSTELNQVVEYVKMEKNTGHLKIHYDLQGRDPRGDMSGSRLVDEGYGPTIVLYGNAWKTYYRIPSMRNHLTDFMREVLIYETFVRDEASSDYLRGSAEMIEKVMIESIAATRLAWLAQQMKDSGLWISPRLDMFQTFADKCPREQVCGEIYSMIQREYQRTAGK